MIKIRDIEKAVTKLPERDFSRFRTWFQKYEAAKWDRKFEENLNHPSLHTPKKK